MQQTALDNHLNVVSSLSSVHMQTLRSDEAGQTALIEDE